MRPREQGERASGEEEPHSEGKAMRRIANRRSRATLRTANVDAAMGTARRR